MGVSGDVHVHSALQYPSLPQAQQPESVSLSAAVTGPPGGRHALEGSPENRHVPGAHGSEAVRSAEASRDASA
jgi:hypothetical protein